MTYKDYESMSDALDMLKFRFPTRKFFLVFDKKNDLYEFSIDGDKSSTRGTAKELCYYINGLIAGRSL
jgi:hypothetical protein